MIVAVLLAVPLVTLFVECTAAGFPGCRRRIVADGHRPRIDVLVPAHNEAEALQTTLPLIRAQLDRRDRLWVVADNCQDETAEVARAHGARTLLRQCEERRGKGYALDHGLRAIGRDPGEVVVVVDADCLPEPGALGRLAHEAAARGRPVQGAYLMKAHDEGDLRERISQCAVTLKNLIRPLGLSHLGIPCVLTGSGMAFPWTTIRQARLATGHIVEDMQLSIELVLDGNGPWFCGEAVFIAALPGSRAATATQRTRWEHGHLQVLLTQVPRLLASAVFRARLESFAVAADLAVPPLSLLGLVWTVAAAAAVTAGMLGYGWWAALILGIVGAAAFAAVSIALWRHVPRGSWWKLPLAVPRYMVGKVPIYLAFLFRRQRTWVRTPRERKLAVPSSSLPLKSHRSGEQS